MSGGDILSACAKFQSELISTEALEGHLLLITYHLLLTTYNLLFITY